jgi:outer membrane biosynthesis protein TonB
MSERIALLISGAGHLLLLAILSLSLARSMQPLSGPMDMTTVDIIGLSAAAPTVADALADIGEPAPPTEMPVQEPVEIPPEPLAPAEPEPAPRPVEDRSAQDILAVEPTPVRERPRREPAQQAFDAQSIERLIDRAAPARPAPAPGASATGAQRLDARTVASLEQAIRSQIAPCWNPPIGGADVRHMTAVLRIRLNRDGSIAAPPELISQTGATPGNAAYARAFVDTARRAVLRCTPLTLPPDLYGWWRDFELNFDPRLMT